MSPNANDAPPGGPPEPRHSLWRDPVLLIPLVAIAGALWLLASTWAQFTAPSTTHSATASPTPIPSDPAAVALLTHMEAAMNRLSSLKAVQVLKDDSGHSLTTHLLYAAPNKVYLKTSTGDESIVIGSRQWERGSADTVWTPIQRVKPFIFPDFQDYGAPVLEVKLGTQTRLEGLATQSVTFALFTPAGRIQFEVFANPQTLRFQRMTMEAPDHHMVTDYDESVAVVDIMPPPADTLVPKPGP